MDIEKKRNTLLHYKKEDIRGLIAEGGREREVSARFDFGFGKRPDIVEYPKDILDMVQRGATSFHFSEERWLNPMQLSPNLRKEQLDDLRIGWDLVLDIDCPYWEFSKLIAKLFLVALEKNKIEKSVSIKFSGNKGFHIGVPFECFPKDIDGKETKKLFPDAAKVLATYLIEYIDNSLVKVKDNTISFYDKDYPIEKLQEITGKKLSELTDKLCPKCNTIRKEEKKQTDKFYYFCERCGKNHTLEKFVEFKKCESCGFLIKGEEKKQNKKCRCGSTDVPIIKFNTLSIVEVDTVLISSRHLYRSEYSMHEKSGLVSVPFNPKKIDLFEKSFAKIDKVKLTKFRFLDRENAVANEANYLFDKAFYWHRTKEQKKSMNKEYKEAFKNYMHSKSSAALDEFENAIPVDFFPPCIKKGLMGIEDGRKRFLFLATNFLTSCGYDYESVEKMLMDWNKNNPNPLRDFDIKNQVRYHKQHKKKVLPPNCENKAYYADFGICTPDEFCKFIKNPVQYAKKKHRMNEKPKRKKKVVQNTKKQNVSGAAQGGKQKKPESKPEEKKEKNQ